MHRQHGEVIVRREVLGLGLERFAPDPSPTWWGQAWEAVPVHVVDDDPDRLVTYIAEGAELGFVDGDWPTPDGLHPWHGRGAWTGHGCLMVQRPGDPFAVWHFWLGDGREFLCWYLNLQTDFVRTVQGYDTQDLELDIVVFPDGSHVVKDLDLLDQRVDEGRWSDEAADWIRSVGSDLVARLESEGPWWDEQWSEWEPPSGWRDTTLPAGWSSD